LQFEFSETSERTMFRPIGQCPYDSFRLTSVHYFGHILLTDCPFDLIFLPLAS
jgi:hypothetical protein